MLLMGLFALALVVLFVWISGLQRTIKELREKLETTSNSACQQGFKILHLEGETKPLKEMLIRQTTRSDDVLIRETARIDGVLFRQAVKLDALLSHLNLEIVTEPEKTVIRRKSKKS